MGSLGGKQEFEQTEKSKSPRINLCDCLAVSFLRYGMIIVL